MLNQCQKDKKEYGRRNKEEEKCEMWNGGQEEKGTSIGKENEDTKWADGNKKQEEEEFRGKKEDGT